MHAIIQPTFWFAQTTSSFPSNGTLSTVVPRSWGSNVLGVDDVGDQFVSMIRHKTGGFSNRSPKPYDYSGNLLGKWLDTNVIAATFAGGIASPDGLWQYAVPYNFSDIIAFHADSTDGTYGYLSSGLSIGAISSFSGGYIGGACNTTGKAVVVPHNNTSWAWLDTTTNTTTTSVAAAGGGMWAGGCLAPNGKVYCAPYNSTAIAKADPVLQTVSTFGSFAGSSKYMGIAANYGTPYMYCIPYDATQVLKIDTSNDTATLIGASLGATAGKWAGGVWGSDGKIYGIPYNSTSILQIDPSNDTVATFGTMTGTAPYYAGGSLIPSGQIFCTPFNNNTQPILYIDCGVPTTLAVCKDPILNKF